MTTAITEHLISACGPFPADQAAEPSAEQYRTAAVQALRQAIKCRDDSLSRCCAFDRRIDRRVMRTYALEWRVFYVHAGSPVAAVRSASRAPQVAGLQERASAESAHVSSNNHCQQPAPPATRQDVDVRLRMMEVTRARL